jgi:predicted glycoside hydrolase/deacetylase ChbG (UPF0249 family)
MKARPCLLITADDGGFCDSIDRGILELAGKGILTGVSAFSSFHRIGAFAKLLGAHSALGIHFNLSSGAPLSNPSRIPSLVDNTGMFHSPTPRAKSGMLRSLNRFVQHRVPLFNRSEMCVELTRQLRTFEDHAGPPAFATVHHDLDRIKTVQEVVGALVPHLACRQARLKAAKLSEVLCRFLTDEQSMESARDAVLAMLVKARRLLRKPHNLGSVEIVCHPGYASRKMGEFTVYVTERELELSAWSSAAVSIFLSTATRTALGWSLYKGTVK